MALYTSIQLIHNLVSPVIQIEDFLLISGLLFTVSYLFMLFCFLKILHLLKGYRQSLKNFYSDMHRKKLNWFSLLIYFVIFISLTDIFSRILEILKPEFQYNFQVIDIIEIAFVITISFFALLQPEIIQPVHEKRDTEKDKYGSSRLTSREVVGYRSRLETYMKDKKPYLHDLSLPGLAESTGMNVHTLSQVINKGQEGNFHSYINTYRVEEVIRLMSDDGYDQCSILELSLEAGFNSKSVFYSFFKLQTGYTPSAYRKKIKNK